jgi:hypothetical protein
VKGICRREMKDEESSAWTEKHLEYLEREALEGVIGCVKSAGDSCVG